MTEWWAAVVLGGIGIVAWLVATAWRGARAHTAAPAAQASLREGLDVFLAPWRADLDRTRRQVVRISLEPLDQDELLRSKVGGQAWWPEGEPAPTAADGTALVLLAQIDLGEMPAIAGFPDRGLLQFFISATSGFGADWDQEGDSLVAYWPDVSMRARRLPVAGDREYLPHRPSRPLAMHFELRDELVSSTDHRFRALCGGRVFEAAARFAATRGWTPICSRRPSWSRSRALATRLAATRTSPRTIPAAITTRKSCCSNSIPTST